MSSIKIVSVPPGQAPEEVREKWVGVIIPLPEQVTGGFQMGVQGGTSDNTVGYQVSTEEALRLLYEKSPAAVQWFLENAVLGTRLVFANQVCELVP